MDGELSAAELEAILGDDGVRVVDIRRRAAFERGHIPGSENIPFDELPREVDRLDGAAHVVTVCPHGHASQQAASLIASYEGIGDEARVDSLACGIEGWPGDLERATDDEGPETDAPF